MKELVSSFEKVFFKVYREPVLLVWTVIIERLQPTYWIKSTNCLPMRIFRELFSNNQWFPRHAPPPPPLSLHKPEWKLLKIGTAVICKQSWWCQFAKCCSTCLLLKLSLLQSCCEVRWETVAVFKRIGYFSGIRCGWPFRGVYHSCIPLLSITVSVSHGFNSLGNTGLHPSRFCFFYYYYFF